jgi:hypothetical protein
VFSIGSLYCVLDVLFELLDVAVEGLRYFHYLLLADIDNTLNGNLIADVVESKNITVVYHTVEYTVLYKVIGVPAGNGDIRNINRIIESE